MSKRYDFFNKRADDTEEELDNIYEEKAKVRFREKWVEIGERSIFISLGLKKIRQVKKVDK